MPDNTTLTETLSNFLTVLETENRAIVAQDWARLPSITEEKITVIAALPNVNTITPTEEETALLRQCQKQNEINGALLHSTQQNLQKLQSILFPQHANLYDAKGENARLSTSGRRIKA